MGRLPVTVKLQALDVDALVRILVEPKNSLVKQYQALFEIDGVQLEFEPEALRVIAQQAYDRKTGARGLRSILEDNMTNVMFDLPSNEHAEKVIITKDCVGQGEKPQVIENPAHMRKLRPANKGKAGRSQRVTAS